MGRKTRPKQIGSDFERDVADWLAKRLGQPMIDRLSLHGNRDVGDVGWLTASDGQRGTVECKCVAEWGPALLSEWQRQTVAERANAGCDFAILVVKTPGIGLAKFGQTRTFVQVRDVLRMLGIVTVLNDEARDGGERWVETTLEEVCQWLTRG